MRILTLLFLILTLLITGCSSEPKQLPYTLKISTKGIGRINRDTPFNPESINTKLLGFDVQQFTFFKAGTPHPVIRVTHNDKEIMLIYPTDNLKFIHSISISNSDVKNSDAPLGTNFKDINQKRFRCTEASEAGIIAHMNITCKLNDSDTLTYLFQDNILKEIVWTPSR